MSTNPFFKQFLLGYLKNASPLSLDHATHNITSDLMRFIIELGIKKLQRVGCLSKASWYCNYQATTEKLSVIGVCMPEL
ncbi:hypothetical protein CMV_021499 [Castanea mollissima]|uniref:Uncharacterized protein n=1 Tax=Castanea mollissima TaxID=60419 RepID=A0A8J4VEZ2_9ROSI|nr:hypothetical protein CMV_021499 [Castanea mollissima]